MRRVNERIRELARRPAEIAGFYCECGAPECSAIVALPREQFDALCADADSSLVARGHVPHGHTVLRSFRGIAVATRVPSPGEKRASR